jgi:hypothetical protein
VPTQEEEEHFISELVQNQLNLVVQKPEFNSIQAQQGVQPAS